MTSEARIRANRRNALKGTGPRTLAGKTRSRRNALRHGLAATKLVDATLTSASRQLAKALCGNVEDRSLFERALLVAESEFVLFRIRSVRIQTMQKHADLGLVGQEDPLSAALTDLELLDRYERQAWRRRRGAVRRYIDLTLSCPEHDLHRPQMHEVGKSANKPDNLDL